jgi:PST family polysaccharide transporter
VPLANYTLSYRVLMLPIQVLGQTANRLVFPVFSRLIDDKPRQARYFSSVLTGISISVLLPMTIVALAAPAAVPIVFGPDWGGAVRAMQILAMSAVLRTISSVSSAVLFANGRADWVFRLNLVSIPAHLVGFAVGLRWGIEGVAWSFIIVALPLTFLWLMLTRRLIPLGTVGQLRALAPALTGAVTAVVVWQALDWFDIEGFAWLAVSGLVALVAGLGAVVLLWRGPTRELVAFARLVGSRKRTDGDQP